MSRLVRATLLSAALLLPSLPARAQVGHAQTPSPPPASEDLSMEVMKSFGCLTTGTAGTLAAIGFGPENLVNLVSGGIVTPANSAVLAIGVVGVVFASFCTVGESLTPSVLYVMDRTAPVAARITDTTLDLAATGLESATSAARATGAAVTGTLAPALRDAAGATIATAADAIDTVATTTQRLGATALATATEAIGAATAAARGANLTPSAWADAGWNALADLCLQSPLCRARVAGPPPPPRDVASR